MDQDFVATVVYPCPRCGVGLEAPSVASPEWLRCPRCGTGGLPPFPSSRPKGNARPPKLGLDPDVLYIGDDDEGEPEGRWGVRMRPDPTGLASRRPWSNAIRTGLTVVFSLCISLFAVMLFLGENFKAGLFGVGAGLLLLMLVRPAPRSRS
ncbi:hypothetical protein TA3x_005289 [Tundrisphaera sp. TA3]|uniref:hypothetical protein n=1 Tax=Tundrisphaera sp. TA3 TaxID=3435775 RepID=UPI003EBBFC50